MSTVLCIPDIQVPYEHRDAIAFLTLVNKTYKPDIVVQIGDLADQHWWSRWGQSTASRGGREEINDAVNQLQGLYKLFPKVYVCWGNHDLRIIKKAAEAGIDESFLKTYNEILKMPKKWVIEDSWEFDEVIYEHGIGRSGALGALNAAKANMKSTVIGHLHSHAGILWYGNKRHLIFGFNVGCLIDVNKFAFEYDRFNAQKPILGCGIIIDGTPVFIPMIIGANHRWIGKI